jgi:subtilisin-like proprotein convertase family protein
VLYDDLENIAVHVEVPTTDFDPEANLGRWEFAVMGHDDAHQIAFLQLNGKLYSESTAGLTIRDTDAALSLGGFIAPWDGILDDVMIWNRVLTAAERASVFQRGLVCP